MLDYKHILQELPCIYFVKNKKFEYLCVNQAGLNASRLKSPEEIVGKTDYEMPWGPLASKFIEQDIQALEGKTQYTLEENPPPNHGSNTVVLLKKAPFYNKNKEITGIACVGFELSAGTCKDFFSLVMQAKLNFQNFLTVLPPQKENFIYGELKFSKRQAQLLSCLLRGYPNNKIAEMLNLSQRTVEFYFNILKEKLQCKTKSEIIQKAFDLGFVDLMFWNFSS